MRGSKHVLLAPTLPRSVGGAPTGSYGFADAIWQVERDGAETVQVSTPPEHGYVVPGAIIDGVLIMVVDQRASASGVGDCYGDPMP